MSPGTSHRSTSGIVRQTAALACAALMLSLVGCARPAATFDSPDAASSALVGALEAGDSDRVRVIFGSAGDDIVSSGDPVEDRAARDRFLAAYREGHRMVESADGSRTLELGPQGWTFPVPIVRVGNAWAFDAAAGREEILNRRIGENELSTILACLAFVDAQQDYAHMDPDGDGIPEYAAKFVSDDGKRNGLYWPAEEGKPESPLGPLVAIAAQEGYSTDPSRAPRPFHGYLYRMLWAQGPNAPGGARDYILNGRRIGGFAMVASPADYGNSGVMTFIVSQDGVVYQRDLGTGTATAARTMRAFDPGEGWERVATVNDSPDAIR